MRGCEVAGCCCAPGESASDAGVVDFMGFFGRGEGGFDGIGVGFEPGEEGRFAEETGVGVLGGVNVGVYALGG